jgi:hypothetical protein
LDDDLNDEPFRHINVGLGSTAGRRDVGNCGVAFNLTGRKSKNAPQLYAACFSGLMLFVCAHGIALSSLAVTGNQ